MKLRVRYRPKWKKLTDFCILETNTTGRGNGDRVLEICCARVRDEKIVDRFYSKINPNYRIKKYAERYKEYLDYPTLQEIAPKLFEFIGKDIIAGWCIDYDFEVAPILWEEKNEHFDIFEEFYSITEKILEISSLENVYEYILTDGINYGHIDYNSVFGRIEAVLSLITYRNTYTRSEFKDIHKQAYL